MEGLVFPVEQIPAEGLSGRRTLEPSWFALPPDADDSTRPIILQEPIEVHFRLDHSGRDVRLQLGLTTVANLTCSRCVNSFPFPIAVHTQFTFCRPPAGSQLKREMELEVDDLESGTFEGDEIDLSKMTYEQIVLSFPMKPLCHEGCKGLCPRCGADRNVESCECASTKSDPRWEALRRLKLHP
jgi:uncharacterized protein